MVLAIASGEMTPVWKTLSPRRTTSRSSCSVLRRCCCTDAILRRTELEPISIAANVGIVLYLSRRLSSAKLLDAGEDSSSQVKIHRSEDSCAHAKFLLCPGQDPYAIWPTPAGGLAPAPREEDGRNLVPRMLLVQVRSRTITASPEPATTSRRAEQFRYARVLTFLCALWAILFLASLFAPPVLDDADGTHANAARQMLLSGDWVTLRVNNVRYLEKAPLPYWIVAASFRLFGFNAFAAHLPQALAVLLLMLLGFRWAREAFGERAALYTGLGVLTSAGVFLFTRVLIPDVLLSLLLAAALYCFLNSLDSPVSSSRSAPLLSSRSAAEGSASSSPATNLYPYAM